MNKYSILYIDDEVINLMNFKLIFSDSFIIHTALTTDAAYGILKSEPVSIIFSDQRMPKVTGTDFFYAINRVDEYKKIPKVIITGHLNNDEVEIAFRDGVIKKIINKPYNEEEIAGTVKELIADL